MEIRLIHSLGRSRVHLAIVVLLLLGGAAFRIYFVQVHSAFMQSDEALFGLMAKHTFTRGYFPIFAFGEERSGALVSYLVAPLLHLFGTSNLVFKIVTTLLSLVAVYLLYLLARRIGGDTVGLMTMALAAFAPPFLIMWSVHAAAEYMLTMVFGVSSLLLCDRILFSRRVGPAEKSGRRHLVTYGMLGFVLGIGFWVSPLIISFIAAVWVALFLNDRKCFFRSTFLVFLISFSVGNLPAILFNALPSLRAAGGMPDAPNWVSYTSLFTGSTEPLWSRIQQIPSTLLQVVTVSMPVMLGGSLWEYETSLVRRSMAVVMVSFWLVAAVHTLGARLGIWTGQDRKRWELRPIDPLFLQFALSLVIFALSQYRWLAREPRYLVPMSAFLLVAGGCFLAWLYNRRKALGCSVLALVLLLNVTSTVWFSESLDPDHGLWPKDGELIQYLIDNEIHHPVANYWIAYSIAFESDEKVIPVPIGYSKFAMYEGVLQGSTPGHYLFRKRAEHDSYFEFFRYGLAGPQWSAQEFRDYLGTLGVPEEAFDAHEFEHYVLYDVPKQYLDPEAIALPNAAAPKDDYVEVRDYLRSAAESGDVLLLNPPELLEPLSQQGMGEIAVYAVPEQSPFDEAAVSAKLARHAKDHRRIYLLLGDTSASDPGRYVEGWLNRHAFRADARWISDLLLVVYGTTTSSPAEQPSELREVLFGDAIELTGTDVAEEWVAPGDVVLLTLFWQARQPMTASFKVFVHLLNADRELVAQRDSEPVGGLQPTSTWQVGESVVDRYGLLLPDDLPEGDYQIIVGLYDPATGGRLPVTVDAGVPPRDFLDVGSIHVGQ